MGPFRHFYLGDFMLFGREEEEDAEDGADFISFKATLEIEYDACSLR